MIGRWPRLLLLLLSVCNTHIFFLSKVLSCFCASYFFFSLSCCLLGFLTGDSRISFCPFFDALFLQPLSTAKASDDARRTLDHQRKLFSLRSEWCYECSSSLSKLSLQKEREKRSQHIFIQKPSRIERLFQPKTGCFLHQKKEKNNCENKILARKTPLRVSRRTTQRRKRRTERERKFRLLFFPSFCAFLEDFFRARERDRETERERKNFIRVVASLTSENWEAF